LNFDYKAIDSLNTTTQCLSCENHTENHHHTHFHEKYHIDNILVKINYREYKREELDKLIGEIIWNLAEKHNFQIIRLKGVIYQQEKVFYIQGIYDIYEIDERCLTNNYNFKEKSNNSKILFIGRNLESNKDILNKIFY
jgi:G3E family GTPase